jgi:hypothetical protein
MKIVLKLFNNYNSEQLEKILPVKCNYNIKTNVYRCNSNNLYEYIETSYLKDLGIQCFNHHLHWRWLVANVLLNLSASEVAKLSQVCKRWKALIFSTPTWKDRLLSAEKSSISIFREVLRQGGLSKDKRIQLYCHELSPRVLGGNGKQIRSKLDRKTMNLRYAHAKSTLELVIRKGSVNISSPSMSNRKATTTKVDFHAATALIDEDVRRTFGISNINSNSSTNTVTTVEGVLSHNPTPRAKKMECLRNVLRSYICQNNDVGYCQGMDYVTSFLLEQANWDEATAFALLDMLMEERNLGEMFSIGLPGLRRSFHQFNVLMAMHAPDLTIHFEKEQIDATMFATNWFMTLFTDYKLLPQKCVLTIFDMFIVDGWPVS